ncbi:hypothetical protein C8Q76DRAFT_746671 [Earliella scabrosa]|nr:hypothetical protein C8Q76DRAFT_746671 [Earliella scabrosa]
MLHASISRTNALLRSIPSLARLSPGLRMRCPPSSSQHRAFRATTRRVADENSNGGANLSILMASRPGSLLSSRPNVPSSSRPSPLAPRPSPAAPRVTAREL